MVLKNFDLSLTNDKLKPKDLKKKKKERERGRSRIKVDTGTYCQCSMQVSDAPLHEVAAGEGKVSQSCHSDLGLKSVDEQAVPGPVLIQK